MPILQVPIHFRCRYSVVRPTPRISAISVCLIPLSIRPVRSGRLRLDLQTASGTRGWADRTRCRLEQKLPYLFAEIETRAAELARSRARSEDERLRRRAAWDEAIERARQDYLYQLDRDRLRDQLARSADADAIRAYCARLQARADRLDDPRAARLTEWLRWAGDEADRIDPLNRLDEWVYLVPSEILPSDLAPYVPRGFSPYRPPD
uniref:Uncharacterized protein n=1 Tax=Rhodococcus sp. NS1 TaxID=402236 RepID=A0A097SQZ0_9NOCA|nr:hypothetical protein LRS1606.524 [Rhodococcus sp. NS1]